MFNKLLVMLFWCYSFPSWDAIDLEIVTPGADECGTDLFERLMAVNPAQRVTAQDALLHRFLMPSTLVASSDVADK